MWIAPEDDLRAAGFDALRAEPRVPVGDDPDRLVGRVEQPRAFRVRVPVDEADDAGARRVRSLDHRPRHGAISTSIASTTTSWPGWTFAPTRTASSARRLS